MWSKGKEKEKKKVVIPSEVIGTGRDNEIKFRAGLYIGRVESRQDFLILDLLYFKIKNYYRIQLIGYAKTYPAVSSDRRIEHTWPRKDFFSERRLDEKINIRTRRTYRFYKFTLRIGGLFKIGRFFTFWRHFSYENQEEEVFLK